MDPLLVILGPTAVGKTKIAIAVAQKLAGEIISADSMQVYRHLDIGTAKPSLAERQGVPHHLIDLIEPEEQFSVVRFQNEVKRLIPAIVSRGHLPMLVGGTGLYISAVINNYQFAPSKPDPSLRKQLLIQAANLGPQVLHEKLSRLDAAAAERIEPTDVRRIIRALEVASTGDKLSACGQGPLLYRVLQIGLIRERSRLYEAINQRVETMFEQGLCEEARWLLEKNLSPNSPVCQALGYKEIWPYFHGQATLNEVKEKVKRQTRRFAKRQLTWFRRDKRIIWLDIDQYTTEEALVTEIVRLTEGKLLVNHE
ncbi:MAG: tRNA (adenosine(37)-N6)-dimethylallyltransferase MiaA [Firmicutes bacterium]|jgi:tRNA dimethylallyltransferase|nr:tRNA (adenosine(37)-N6)-dimethylallyltransferase MiaA [Bacillota bacterium]